MKELINYLDDLYNKCGSDNKASRQLDISRESINQIRKRGSMSDETAIKLAEALKVEETELLIAAAIARSKDKKTAESWKKIAKRLEATALTITIITCLNYPTKTTAKILDLTINSIHYAKLFLRRSRLKVNVLH